jgi:CTP:molybdopterin cytidylyltransferase MocA
MQSTMPCVRLDTLTIGELVQDWYATAAPGATLVVAVPGHAWQQVRLLHQARQRVHWWPRGEKGMTMGLAEAVRRLQML